MNVALWVVQGLLAVVFLTSGLMKSVMSKDRMIATGQTGVRPFPLPMIRVVAIAELLAVAGLILPGLLADSLWSWAPVLTPLAAVGLSIVMIGAFLGHRLEFLAATVPAVRRKELGNLATNTVIFVACVLVAVGRFSTW